MISEPVEAPPAPAKRRRGWKALVLALVLAVGGGGAYAAWAMGGTPTGAPVQVVIPEGANGAQIAELLADNEVVRSAFMFRLVARFRGVGGTLKPGAYQMRVGLGVDGAIEQLLDGVPLKVFRFTIPEGKTVVEIAEIVARRTPISRDAFMREVRSGTHRIDIMPRGVDSLEGLLFPKTYEVVERTTAGEVVDMLLRQFEAETAGLDFRGARRFGLSPWEAVIVASLIEREAKLADEQPLVSSVIYNRLERPMRLEIDATIQYVYIQQNGEPKHPLTFDDYELESPYNTYRIDGLPPTPIAAPGLGALQAALDPATTGYYFYKLSADGSEHCFGVDGHGTAECANP